MIIDLKIEQGGEVWARGRNGYFKPRQVSVMKQEAGYVVIDVSSRRTGPSTPIILSLNNPDAVKLACAILGIDGPPGDGLFDDVLNVCDYENIDVKIFEDHPDLKAKILKDFQYDYSDYNEYLADYIRDQAGELKIKIEDYENDT
jgi:hypothetical protein